MYFQSSVLIISVGYPSSKQAMIRIDDGRVEEDLGKYAGMPGKCKFLLENGGNLMSPLLDIYDIKH